MRNLISAAIVTACVLGIGAPALAAPHMGAQQAPHMAAHQMQTSIHNGGGLRGHDHGHRPEGRHRRGISVPLGVFDSALSPDETGVPPEDPNVYAPPTAPPSPAVDLPPCRETGAGGVVILRGTGCTPEKG